MSTEKIDLWAPEQDGAPHHGTGGGGLWRRPSVAGPAVAAAIAAILLAGTMIGGDNGGENGAASDKTGVVSAPTGPGPVGQSSSKIMGYDLRMLVQSSPRIVVGTVSEVKKGRQSEDDGGMSYALATIKVSDTLRGAKADKVVAFDYVYPDNSLMSDSPMGADFVKNQKVLLFLSSSAGTVHEKIGPKHWQVTGGFQGMYAMKSGEPQADFTLADVRAEVAKQK
jgi:hypothetical protein